MIYYGFSAPWQFETEKFKKIDGCPGCDVVCRVANKQNVTFFRFFCRHAQSLVNFNGVCWPLLGVGFFCSKSPWCAHH
jgi:hypothetical protein